MRLKSLKCCNAEISISETLLRCEGVALVGRPSSSVKSSPIQVDLKVKFQGSGTRRLVPRDDGGEHCLTELPLVSILRDRMEPAALQLIVVIDDAFGMSPGRDRALSDF